MDNEMRKRRRNEKKENKSGNDSPLNNTHDNLTQRLNNVSIFYSLFLTNIHHKKQVITSTLEPPRN